MKDEGKLKRLRGRPGFLSLFWRECHMFWRSDVTFWHVLKNFRSVLRFM
jgi:hypothetical protein